MEQIKTQYYPEDKEFTEISIKFYGFRNKPRDIKCYLDLISLNKKLEMKYPDYIVNNDFFSYGNFCRYEIRAILDDEQNMNNVKAICNKLLEYGVKSNSIPMIEFIRYGKQCTRYTLENYLETKGIKLEELQIEELTEKGKTLVR